MTPSGEIVRGLLWFEYLRTDVRKFWNEQMSPPQNVIRNAKRVGQLYTPARNLWGRTAINSGWRCPGLNAYVGGAQQSLHVKGLALDCKPLEMDLFDAYVVASQLPIDVFPYDLLIFEFDWIHMQCTRETSATPRRKLLMSFGKGYRDWDPTSPDVQRVRKSPKLAEAPGP